MTWNERKAQGGLGGIPWWVIGAILALIVILIMLWFGKQTIGIGEFVSDTLS